MSDNGTFRKKKGFTMAGNTLTRDSRLSLKAKGLYLLIMSYITFEDISLTKSFIHSFCIEKEKAFESIWNELKESGYLKVYLQPSTKGWQVEYELLEEPNKGPHTFYLTATGEISCTNIDREQNRKLKEKTAYPYEGSNAEHTLLKDTNAEGSNAKGCIAKGGNNIKTLNNTKDKTINNIPSFVPELVRMNDEENTFSVEEELDKHDGIPYEYNQDICKMTEVIHYLTDWKTYHINGFEDKFKQSTFNLAVEALIEMACEIESKTYNKRRVTYEGIIDKINQTIRGEPCKNIRNIIEQSIDDYIKASSKENIEYPRNYIKSCILENFDTYQLKFGSFFNRTYYRQDYSNTTTQNA